MTDREESIKVVLMLVKKMLSEADLSLTFDRMCNCLCVLDHQTEIKYVLLEGDENWVED